jgi:uncharacterized membrane protein
MTIFLLLLVILIFVVAFGFMVYSHSTQRRVQKRSPDRYCDE